MKVIYVEGIVEKIQRARREAKAAQREVEKVIISPKEARELLNAIGTPWVEEERPGAPFCEFDFWLRRIEAGMGLHAGPQPSVTVMGLRVEVER